MPFVHQKEYEAAMTALAEIEKGLTAESTLDGAVQNESGDANTVSSSRYPANCSLWDLGHQTTRITLYLLCQGK